MKKNLIFPCTVLRPFIVALPMVAILIAAIWLNGTVDTILRLYPLIAVSAFGIIFTFVYFFKIITLSKDEVKYVGVFSSRDSAVINEGKTIILTKKKRGRIRIDLFGNNGKNAELDWLKNDQTVRDIYLFRGKALGGNSAIKRTLEFFNVPAEDIIEFLSVDTLAKEYDDCTVNTELADGEKQIKIKLKKTL